MTLPEYITANLQRPFAWGEHDCVLFVAGWLKHATGTDHLECIPKWHTAKEAMRIVRSMGGMRQLLDDRFAAVHPNLAKDGDLALYEGRAAIFSGPHIVGPGATGIVAIDRMKAECAWSL